MIKLSLREVQMLHFASQGWTQTETAKHLGLSLGTVRTHHQNLLRKLKTPTIASAVAWALRNGVIT